MGQKTHPIGFRTGYVFPWQSRWFSKKDFNKILQEDFKIRSFINERFSRAGLKAVEIERTSSTLLITIHTSKPGVLIGRGGEGIEKIRGELKKLFNRKGNRVKEKDFRLNVEEVRAPETQALIVASNVAQDLEKRLPFRRVMRKTVDSVSGQKDVKGVKILLSGRLNGAEIARSEWLKKGELPLSTLRANIDYAGQTAFTTYGTIGIKVWIYKGEIF
ncbi:MAG: 30S ribosomal protein S3 [Parcubacteria group bacterium]|nr:30S ribosomal protein S3 [Parcubacteria group bacterium]